MRLRAKMELVLGLPLLLLGLALAVVGVRTATTRRRPIDLAGALLAGAGLVVSYLGAGRLLSPTFFGLP